MLDLAVRKIKTALLSLVVLFSLLLCHVISPPVIIAEGPPSAFSGEYLRLLVLDTTYTLTAPAHWGRGEWRNFSLYTAGIGAVMLLDKQHNDALQTTNTALTDDLAKSVQEV